MAAMRDRGHRQVEHTADLALEVWAADEAQLLEEAMQAVVEILTGGARLSPNANRVVELDALDSEDRLVRWLNEILYLAMVEGFTPCEASITLREAGLRAELRGDARADPGDPGPLVTEIKSATYHALRVEVSPEQARARIVLDV